MEQENDDIAAEKILLVATMAGAIPYAILATLDLADDSPVSQKRCIAVLLCLLALSVCAALSAFLKVRSSSTPREAVKNQAEPQDTQSEKQNSPQEAGEDEELPTVEMQDNEQGLLPVEVQDDEHECISVPRPVLEDTLSNTKYLLHSIAAKNDEIEASAAQIDSAKQELDAQRQSIYLLGSRVSFLEIMLESSKRVIGDLGQQLVASLGKSAQLQTGLEAIAAEFATQNNELQGLRAQLAASKEANGDLVRERKKQEATIADAGKQIDEQKKAAEDASSEHVRLQGEINDLKSQLKHATDNARESDAGAQKLEAALSGAEQKTTSFEKRVEDMTTKLGDSAAERDDLVQHLAATKGTIEKLEAEAIDMASKLETSAKENSDLKGQLSSANHNISTLEKESEDTAANLGNLTAERDDLEAQLSAARNIIADLENDVQQTQAKTDKEIFDLKGEIYCLEWEIDDTNEKAQGTYQMAKAALKKTDKNRERRAQQQEQKKLEREEEKARVEAMDTPAMLAHQYKKGRQSIDNLKKQNKAIEKRLNGLGAGQILAEIDAGINEHKQPIGSSKLEAEGLQESNRDPDSMDLDEELQPGMEDEAVFEAPSQEVPRVTQPALWSAAATDLQMESTGLEDPAAISLESARLDAEEYQTAQPLHDSIWATPSSRPYPQKAQPQNSSTGLDGLGTHSGQAISQLAGENETSRAQGIGDEQPAVPMSGSRLGDDPPAEHATDSTPLELDSVRQERENPYAMWPSGGVRDDSNSRGGFGGGFRGNFRGGPRGGPRDVSRGGSRGGNEHGNRGDNRGGSRYQSRNGHRGGNSGGGNRGPYRGGYQNFDPSYRHW